MIHTPPNHFQLYNEQHADFQLGANGDKLSRAEEFLWLNIELYSKLIKEAGLEDKLQAAYEQALKDYSQTANDRYQRYHNNGVGPGDSSAAIRDATHTDTPTKPKRTWRRGGRYPGYGTGCGCKSNR